MDIYAKYEDGVIHIKVNGEIDEHTASRARFEMDKFIESHTQSMRAVFDLSEVSFMDSTGIGFLIGRYKKLRRYGIPAYLTNISSTTDKILQISGVYTLIPKV